MCFDPLTALAGIQSAVAGIGTALGSIGTIASIGGGVISAYSQMQNARAASIAATRTAESQDQAARDALEEGKQKSDRQRRAGAALIAENTASMAANGVDVESAQALGVLADVKLGVDEDAFTIRENSRRQAGNYAQAAANSRADAASAKSQAFFAPLKTVLSTAAKVGDRYASWVPEARRTAEGAY